MKALNAWIVVLLSALFFTACNEDDEQPIKEKIQTEGTGVANIYITDAPADNQEVAGVYISINGIEAKGPNGWVAIKNYDEPVVINLLDYQNGKSHFLSDEPIPAGTYSELRMNLNIKDIDGQSGQEGSYLEYKNGTKVSLFAPGGEGSDYKAIGGFTVKENEAIDITMDFDVRKALVEAAQSEKMILKPAIRLVSNDRSGMLEGKVSGAEAFTKVVVLAYGNDSFSESEMDIKDGATRFANAVSSTAVSAHGEFTLAYLTKGTYDLYFVMMDANGKFLNLLGTQQDVTINALGRTNMEIDITEIK